MVRTDRHLPRLLGFFTGIAALVLASSDAHAQFDMGMGMGGFFGFHQVPSPTGYLNQSALAAANRPDAPRGGTTSRISFKARALTLSRVDRSGRPASRRSQAKRDCHS